MKKINFRLWEKPTIQMDERFFEELLLKILIPSSNKHEVLSYFKPKKYFGLHFFVGKN